MKELNFIELITGNVKMFFASVGWKMFIYFSETTEEEYWKQIYEQEKIFNEDNVL